MMRDYELMYIVRPDLDEDGVRAAMDSVQGIVEAQGGEVLSTTPWGKRRLAYEIQKLRDGHYVLLEIRLDGARVQQIERLLAIHDTVFRHMIVNLVEVKGGVPAAIEGAIATAEPDAARARGAENGLGPADHSATPGADVQPTGATAIPADDDAVTSGAGDHGGGSGTAETPNASTTGAETPTTSAATAETPKAGTAAPASTAGTTAAETPTTTAPAAAGTAGHDDDEEVV